MLKILLTGTALALLPAMSMAADLPSRVRPEAPSAMFAPTVSGYLEAGVGLGWANNNYSDAYNPNVTYVGSGRDTKFSLEGAGRANVWLGSNISMQADLWGSSDSVKVKDCPGCGSANDTSFNLGTHLSYRESEKFLVGAYAATGSFNHGYGGFLSGGPNGDSVRHGTLGLEAQGYFGATTLYGQVGYASTLGAADWMSATGWNARAVARHYFNDNLRISGEVGYARIKLDNLPSSEDVVARQFAWGLGVEKKFDASPFSAFVKYEGAQTKANYSATSGQSYDYESFKTVSHAIKAGVRIYFSESTLLANDRKGATLDIKDPFTSIYRGLGLNVRSTCVTGCTPP